MNRQRKVVITITYNEMGIIIDTKAEEVAQPNLQSTCNELATDCISRQAAIDALRNINAIVRPISISEDVLLIDKAEAMTELMMLPSTQPEIVRCKDCEYYHPYYCEQWSKFGTIQTTEDGYCYKAERRADE